MRNEKKIYWYRYEEERGCYLTFDQIILEIKDIIKTANQLFKYLGIDKRLKLSVEE